MYGIKVDDCDAAVCECSALEFLNNLYSSCALLRSGGNPETSLHVVCCMFAFFGCMCFCEFALYLCSKPAFFTQFCPDWDGPQICLASFFAACAPFLQGAVLSWLLHFPQCDHTTKRTARECWPSPTGGIFFPTFFFPTRFVSSWRGLLLYSLGLHG